MLPILWDVLRHYQLQREPLFAGLKPEDPDAEALVHASRSGGRVLEASDQAWLNRHLLEAAFRQATGHPCFRRLDSALDGILVSDVGKRFEVQGNHRAGGLIRTALRSTDIVMDRVWQLETETFQDSPSFVFAPITEVVEPAEDPTALHPEIQRQAVNIRTDFDRFSPLEISSLVRHGYCVGRKVCRAHPDLFGAELPLGPPWDPGVGPRATAPAAAVALPGRGPLGGASCGHGRGAGAARLGPAADLEYPARPPGLDFLRLRAAPGPDPRPAALLRGQVPPAVTADQPSGRVSFPGEPGPRADEPTARGQAGALDRRAGRGSSQLRGVRISRVSGFSRTRASFDLRGWKPVKAAESDPSSLVFGYRRLKVFKQPEKAGDNLFHVYLLGTSPKTAVRFPTQQLQPKLSMCRVEDASPAVRKNIAGAQAMISSMCRPGSSSISSSNTTLLDSICNVAAMGPRWFFPSTRTPRS